MFYLWLFVMELLYYEFYIVINLIFDVVVNGNLDNLSV